MFVGLIVGHSGVLNISYNDKTVKANTMIVILAAKNWNRSNSQQKTVILGKPKVDTLHTEPGRLSHLQSLHLPIQENRGNITVYMENKNTIRRISQTHYNDVFLPGVKITSGVWIFCGGQLRAGLSMVLVVGMFSILMSAKETSSPDSSTPAKL